MTTPPVFLVERALLESSDRVTLDGAEGRHAAKVRRIGVGEQVDLVDGTGLRVRCRVRAASAESLDLAVIERLIEPTPASRVVVVQALAKGDRGELAVEMLTEVGVDEIVPWSAARSIVEWRGDRGARSLERWRATCRESAKQARRARFPEIAALATTADVAQRLRAARLALVLHEAADRGLADLAAETRGDVVLVVGPEGGITDEEIATFKSAAAIPVRLGPTVLRTSTAGVVAAGLVLASRRWSAV